MRIRPAHLLVALLSVALPGSGGPADAASVVGVATGSGAIHPGLTTMPTDQAVTFALDVGAGADADGNPVVATGCTFLGNGQRETVHVGSGSGVIGDCTDGEISGVVEYSRIEAYVAATGALTLNGREYAVNLHCVFEPTDADPVTTFRLQCVLAP